MTREFLAMSCCATAQKLYIYETNSYILCDICTKNIYITIIINYLANIYLKIYLEYWLKSHVFSSML